MLQEKIQKIKDQNMFGILIEVGAGLSVYNELCQHPNTASKIVKFAESPNNWNYSKAKYNFFDGIRAVSPQVCAEISNWHYYQMHNKYDTDFNFILTNTIQIGNDKKTQTHGWFSLATFDITKEFGQQSTTCKYYHFSINNADVLPRRQITTIIANIGIDILVANNNCSQLENGFIDIILDYQFKPNRSDIISSYSNAKSIREVYPYAIDTKLLINDIYTVFTKDGSVIRINDLLRQTKEKNIIIFKGSFNPIHPQHIVLINKAKEEIPDSVVFLQISINNREESKNSDITINNILKRITVLNKLGYNVIINYNGYVNDAYEFYLNLNDFADKKLHFLMGEDTIERFLLDELLSYTLLTKELKIEYFQKKFNNCIFLYGKRNSQLKVGHFKNIKKLDIEENAISSTQIRSCLDAGNTEYLRTLVGTELAQIIIATYGK